MPEISITNAAGRDAAVNMENVRTPLRVRWLDSKNRQARNVRILKSTIDLDVDSLVQQHGDLDDVSQALIDDDPEIDMEIVGTFLNSTSRVFVDKTHSLVHRIQQVEVIKGPFGKERSRRPRKPVYHNVSVDMPLAWTETFIKKTDVVRKFVFANKLQLVHINGLTYDFLFGIAQELEQKESMLLMGAGPKANQPLILRRGTAPYRGFLEGRTDGQRYCLVLHLSNLELKSPKNQPPEKEA